tara:strand:- start:4424 stop:4858 length:435 start_codon:yes stop_codon:yes gene_type:complete
MKYPFRDDDGNIHNLSFEQMMDSKDGFYEMEDGTILRRVHGNTVRHSSSTKERTEIVSDALGFSHLQLNEMRTHLKQSGIKGVEFVKDKTESTFMQVKCDSPRVFQKYMESRGFNDHNSKNGSGAMLSETDIANARELVLRINT